MRAEKGIVFGYARRAGNAATKAAAAALHRAGASVVLVDTPRGAIGSVLHRLGRGDALVVTSISDLGARSDSIIDNAMRVIESGARLTVIDIGLRIPDADSDVVANLIRALRDNDRTGRSSRSSKETRDKVGRALSMLRSDDSRKVAEVAKEVGVSRQTLYRHFRGGKRRALTETA